MKLNTIIFCFDLDTSNKSKLRKGSNLKILDAKPGVYTEYKPFLHKDKSIVKKLLRGMQNKRPEEVQSALLRRHFLELTQSFMIPLERYMSSLMPLQRNISPFKVCVLFFMTVVYSLNVLIDVFRLLLNLGRLTLTTF